MTLRGVDLSIAESAPVKLQKQVWRHRKNQNLNTTFLKISRELLYHPVLLPNENQACLRGDRDKSREKKK